MNGGVIQGVSYALFEERRLDRAQGDMVNPTFDTYRIAGMQDCPEIDVIFTSVVIGQNNVGMIGPRRARHRAHRRRRRQRGLQRDRRAACANCP